MEGICPRCRGGLIWQRGAKTLGTVTMSYEECARVCEPCGIGITNSYAQPSFIHEDWRRGLWKPETANRLSVIMRRTINVSNREVKFARLGHENSEDMLVWNVFSWLEDKGRLSNFAGWVTRTQPKGPARVLYWGANDRWPRGQAELREVLIHVFGEPGNSLTEPDIVVRFDDTLLFIEAKFGTRNPRGQKRGQKLAEYVGVVRRAFRNPGLVARTGYYELAKNWAIGSYLTSKRAGVSFWLVNLVRHGEELDIEEKFGRFVCPKARFKRLRWEDLAHRVCPDLIPNLKATTLHFRSAFAV